MAKQADKKLKENYEKGIKIYQLLTAACSVITVDRRACTC